MKYKSKELVVNEQISEVVKKTKLPKQAQEGLETSNKILGKQLMYWQKQVKAANDYLDKLDVPDSGMDIHSNPGYGKRQELSLTQRLTYLQPIKVVEGLEKLGEQIGKDGWLELFKEFNRSYTPEQQTLINFKLWLQETCYPPKPKK